jgi:hypothetical protein
LQTPAVRTTATAAAASQPPIWGLPGSSTLLLLLHLPLPLALRLLLSAGWLSPPALALVLHRQLRWLRALLPGSCQLVCTPPRCLQLQELQGQQLLLLGLPAVTAALPPQQ